MSVSKKYTGEFTSWKDVMEAFGPYGYIGSGEALTVPEPANLIIADYDLDGYEGEARVLWKNPEGTFGFVHGHHCSCYGLENQWEPEELTKEMIERFIEVNSKWSWTFWFRHAEVIKKALED
jgi:hypothetical protein